MNIPKRSAIARLALVVTIPLTIAGCREASELTRSWQNPAYTRGPVEKLAVFAVMPDPRVRRLMEDTFVGTLPEGAKGVTSYTMYAGLEKISIDEVVSRLKAEGYDGVAVARLLASGEDLKYVETAANYSAWVGNYGFYSYFSSVRAQVFSSGYVREGAGFRIDTRLYSLRADTLAWAGVSTPLETSSMKEAVKDYCYLIIDELVDLGLLRK